MAPSRVRIPPSPLSAAPAVVLRPPAEGWQSGRMRRSRKPLSVVRRIEGSNPSPSAPSASVGADREDHAPLPLPANEGDSGEAASADAVAGTPPYRVDPLAMGRRVDTAARSATAGR